MEALLHVLAQLQEGERLTVVPLPTALATASDPEPGGKRPRRAAARGALAVLQAEHHQAQAGRQASFPELEGRTFRITVSGATTAARAAGAASWRQPAAQPTAPFPEQQQANGGTWGMLPHVCAKGTGGFNSLPPPQCQQAEQQHAEGRVASRMPGEPAAAAGAAVTDQAAPHQDAPGLQGADLAQSSADASLEHQQQQVEAGLPSKDVVHSYAAAAAARLAAAQVAQPRRRVRGQPQRGVRGESGDSEEHPPDEGEEDATEEEEEEDIQPGSPTASEAALLGELMQPHAAGEAAAQPGIAAAEAAATAAQQPDQCRAGGRLGKRKGGMPPLCPSCGQPPLSEEDKRAASKRGRRKKNDGSGEAASLAAGPLLASALLPAIRAAVEASSIPTACSDVPGHACCPAPLPQPHAPTLSRPPRCPADPRNRKAELSREFLVAHLVESRLSLRVRTLCAAPHQSRLGPGRGRHSHEQTPRLFCRFDALP